MADGQWQKVSGPRMDGDVVSRFPKKLQGRMVTPSHRHVEMALLPVGCPLSGARALDGPSPSLTMVEWWKPGATKGPRSIQSNGCYLSDNDPPTCLPARLYDRPRAPEKAVGLVFSRVQSFVLRISYLLRQLESRSWRHNTVIISLLCSSPRDSHTNIARWSCCSLSLTRV